MRPLPAPDFELSFEQKFEMAKLIKGVQDCDPAEIREVCLTLVRTNFILKNQLNNLIRHWHDEDEPRLLGADH